MRGETEKEKLKRRLLKLLDEKNVIKTVLLFSPPGKKATIT